MALVGVTPGAVREYQSKLDPARGTPQATVFKIGSIPTRVKAKLRDRMSRFNADAMAFAGFAESSKDGDGDSVGGPGKLDVAFQIPTSEIAIETVRHGLKGWANYKDEQGNDIPFKTQTAIEDGAKCAVVHESCIERMELELILELAEEIDRVNSVSENERGNSEGSSSQPASSQNETAPPA